MTFEIRKGRFGFKPTAPYSEERRKAAGELAKKENLRRNGTRKIFAVSLIWTPFVWNCGWRMGQ